MYQHVLMGRNVSVWGTEAINTAATGQQQSTGSMRKWNDSQMSLWSSSSHAKFLVNISHNITKALVVQFQTSDSDLRKPGSLQSSRFWRTQVHTNADLRSMLLRQLSSSSESCNMCDHVHCYVTWVTYSDVFFKCCTEFWLGTDLICWSSVTILSWNYTCTLGTRLATDSPWAHRELAELPSAAALTDRLVNKFERHTLKYVLRSKWPWLHAEGQQQMQSNCRRVELKSDSRGCSSTIPIKLLEMPNLYSVMKTCTSWCALVAHQGQIPILLTVKSG